MRKHREEKVDDINNNNNDASPSSESKHHHHHVTIVRTISHKKRVVTFLLGIIGLFGLTQVEYYLRRRSSGQQQHGIGSSYFTMSSWSSSLSSTMTKNKNNKTILPFRVAAFGTSRTWGVGCDDRERQPFCKLLDPNAKNMGIRGTGPDLPSLCVSTMLMQHHQHHQQGDDNNNNTDINNNIHTDVDSNNIDDFNVILLEYDPYMAGAGLKHSLQRLVQRLRHRFPLAIMVFIRIRMLDDYFHTPTKLSSREWLMQIKGHAYHNISNANIANDIWSTQASDWTYPLHVLERQMQNDILQDANVKLLEFPPHQYDDARQDMMEYKHLYGPDDWYHLSIEGHRQLADQIRHLLLAEQQQQQPKNAMVRTRTKKQQKQTTITGHHDSDSDDIDGDSCENWMGGVTNVERWAAGVVPLEYSPEMTIQPFTQYQYGMDGKFALQVPNHHNNSSNSSNDDDYHYIVVDNPFSVPAALYINSMAKMNIWNETTKTYSSYYYPRTLVTVDGLSYVAVIIQPYVDSPRLHVQATTYIAVIPPGKRKVFFQPQPEHVDPIAPFRLTGVVITTAF